MLVARACPPLLILGGLFGCTTQEYVDEADQQVYGILSTVSERVTGDAKTFRIGRREGTLRERLLETPEAFALDLMDSLDVAAENSRDFARQKELLYSAALRLTLEQNNFDVIFGGGGAGSVDGVGDDETNISLSDDLSASVNSTSGGRIVGSIVSNFLRSVVRGGGWDASSILSLSITQPLLRGFGSRIVREPLTQAERDVVYQVRSFERFRTTFAIQIISEYYRVAQEVRNVDSESANLSSVTKSREQIDELFTAGRRSINDIDRARTNELNAENGVIIAQNRLESRLDSFKLTLGLPVDVDLSVLVEELSNLATLGVENVAITEADAIDIALQRRYDYRTVRDQVVDAARRVVIAEDALRSSLDFSSAIIVPTEPDKPFTFDWDEVRWSAGFDLDLNLNRLPERNTYRQALISLDVAMRAREQLEDQIKQQIRNALRNIDTTVRSFRINDDAVRLARRRVDSNSELYLAGRVEAFDVLDAQDALLDAELNLTSALVAYAVARLELLRDLEAVSLEPKGLRVDMALPLPNKDDAVATATTEPKDDDR